MKVVCLILRARLLAEQLLGKEKVPGSNPGVGSTSSQRFDSVISKLWKALGV